MDDRIFSKIISGSDLPGLGSTRWFGYQKKTVVEACLPLDIAVLAREMHFSADCDVKGVFTWTEPETESIRVSSGFVAKTTGGEGWLRLSYELTPTKDAVECSIVLTTTRPTFGGVRWWERCPLCGGRRRILYYPPKGRLFSCRTCQKLTYRSPQEGHRFDRGELAHVAKLWGVTPKQLQAWFGRYP